MAQGLILIHTGKGKGKTTAGFGLALRAVGHGMRVCIIQFIKSNDQTGEAIALKKAFPELLELHVTGTGFTWTQAREQVAAAARAGWRLAEEKILSDIFDLVILDELTYPMEQQIIDEATVFDLLQRRPARLHVLITGRGASSGLIDRADLVTEMVEVKHPFKAGTAGQKGIEF